MEKKWYTFLNNATDPNTTLGTYHFGGQRSKPCLVPKPPPSSKKKNLAIMSAPTVLRNANWRMLVWTQL